MSHKNPQWANWGAVYFVNGKETTKFYRTEIGARVSLKFLKFSRHKEVLLFQIIREEYRAFQDFLTKDDEWMIGR